MRSSPNTGPIVPGWIRDQIAHHEEIWPMMALAAGLIAAMAVMLVLGVLLWTSESIVYYARP